MSFSADIAAEPDNLDANLDGRLLLMISNDPAQEPRFQISDSPTTQLIFGIDVDALAPGEDAIFDAGVLGYPLDSLNDIPSGRYWVQALLHKYETFHRADGHVVKLPMDRGEGQHWNLAIVMDRVIPPIADPPTTDYIKHVKIQSKLLTEFWGRPMHLGAHVLVPEGFDEHPDWREEPPDPNLAPEHSARFDLDGYNRIVQEEAYSFYEEWTGADYPRVI